jgi:hypothetical protein
LFLAKLNVDIYKYRKLILRKTTWRQSAWRRDEPGNTTGLAVAAEEEVLKNLMVPGGAR